MAAIKRKRKIKTRERTIPPSHTVPVSQSNSPVPTHSTKTHNPNRNLGGRSPWKYDDRETPHLAYKFCLLGATNDQLAEMLGISVQTVEYWLRERPRFIRAVNAGKRIADAEVAASLYHRAIGYTCDEEKVFCQGGEIIKTTVKKHYPPDTNAAIFWLKNRTRQLPADQQWRDDRKIDHTNAGGRFEATPIQADMDPKKACDLYIQSLKSANGTDG